MRISQSFTAASVSRQHRYPVVTTPLPRLGIIPAVAVRCCPRMPPPLPLRAEDPPLPPGGFGLSKIELKAPAVPRADHHEEAMVLAVRLRGRLVEKDRQRYPCSSTMWTTARTQQELAEVSEHE